MKKITFLLFGIILYTVFVIVAYKETDDYLDNREKTYVYAPLLENSKIAEYDDFYVKIDALRQLVFNNSIHKIDKKFFRYERDHKSLAKMMLAYMNGETDERPHMECSLRSRIMRKMLDIMAIESRTIVATSNKKNFVDHVFVEVFNPKDRTWHVQDPDHNLTWYIKDSGKRASVKDLSIESIDNLVPCFDAENCPFENFTENQVKKLETLSPYLGFLDFKDEKIDEMIAYNNPAKFSLDQKIEMSGNIQNTLCEAKPKKCNFKIINTSSEF